MSLCVTRSITALAVGILGIGCGLGSRAQEVPFAQTGAPVPAGVYLSDLMIAALQRHALLWSAGLSENWALAAYEVRQLRTRFVDAASTYQSIPVDVVVAMTKALDTVQSAVDAKDKMRFQSSYLAATEACNACHAAAGLRFIQIRTPTAPAFSNLGPSRQPDRPAAPR